MAGCDNCAKIRSATDGSSLCRKRCAGGRPDTITIQGGLVVELKAVGRSPWGVQSVSSRAVVPVVVGRFLKGVWRRVGRRDFVKHNDLDDYREQMMPGGAVSSKARVRGRVAAHRVLSTSPVTSARVG